MKAVFAHDHKFRKIGGEVFSPGGLPNDVLSRYVEWFGALTVVARIIEESEVKTSYNKITNAKITVLTSESLKDTVRSSDCVIARIPSINGYKAIRYAKKFKKPYLVEIVGCTFDAYWNYGTKGKLLAVPAFFVMRHYVKNAPFALYVTSEFLQKRYPCKGKTIGVSDVALEPENGKELKEEIKSAWNVKELLKLGTIGAVDVEYKGQEYVIRAIPMIESILKTRVRYELVGLGDPKRLLKISERFGISDRIVFRGAVPHEDVFRWLDAIDCYVQPSLTEGLSRALIEAMSRGLPCIASNCGGNPELIDSQWIARKSPKKEYPNRIVDLLSKMFSDNTYRKVGVINKQLAYEKYNAQYLSLRRNEFYLSFLNYVIEES